MRYNPRTAVFLLKLLERSRGKIQPRGEPAGPDPLAGSLQLQAKKEKLLTYPYNLNCQQWEGLPK